jgi:hypothetical protein
LKIWNLIAFLIILSVNVLATQECGRFMFLSDLPCIQPSSWKPTDSCSLYNISIFNSENQSIQNLTWSDADPKCIFTFGENITETGIYYWEGQIENGVITLERENNMLSIIILQIFLIAFFIVIGIPHKIGFVKLLSWSFAIIEVLISVWMIYTVESNGEINNLLYFNAIGMLTIGGLLGFISLFAYLRRLADVDNEKSMQDDSYTKFVFQK